MECLHGKQVTETIIFRYPQLSIKPYEGMSQSDEYRKIVRQGIFPEVLNNPFITSELDELFTYEYRSPVSNWDVDLLFLAERADFEQFTQIISYKGEPKAILPSVGACTYRGIINWRKIYSHEEEYLAAGHDDWNEEFSRFTSNPDNFKDSLILISSGYYSAIEPEALKLKADEWKNYSRIIRTYHELLHYYLRVENLRDIDPISEEVLADAVGLCHAFGYYNESFARMFLGIENAEYRKGGRLEHYVTEEISLEQAIVIAGDAIKRVKAATEEKSDESLRHILDEAAYLYSSVK